MDYDSYTEERGGFTELHRGFSLCKISVDLCEASE